MPLVKAIPRGLQNGSTVTEFTDTTNTSAVTYTYPSQQTSLIIENSGERVIYVTVGSVTNQPVQVDTKYRYDGSFITFSIRSDVNSQEFIATSIYKAVQDLTEVSSQLTSLTTSLAGIPNQISYGIPMKGKTQKPLITFIDDDNNAQVYTRLKPIFESRGVPCTVAVPSFSINGDGAMTSAQLLDLQNNLDWEIVSHTKNHIDLNTMTEVQLEEELGGSKSQLESYGLKCNSIVYPHGQQGGDLGRLISRKYFRCGVTTNSTMKQNLPPLSQFSLGRVALGSFFDTPNATYATTDTLAYYKLAVDQAVANNSWVIFMSHIGATDDAQLALIGELIDYIKSLSVDIVTLDKGLDIAGNIIDIGDIQSATSGYFIVDCNGNTTSKVLGLYTKGTTTQYNISTPATSFPLDKITLVVVDSANATGAPSTNRAGILITYRFTEDTYTFQNYITNNQDIMFTRCWKNGAWTEWLKFSLSRPQFTKNIGVLTIAANGVYETNIAYPNVNVLDVLYASPSGGIETGLLWNVYCNGNGNAKLRIHNTTSSSITTVARDWLFTAIV